MKNNDLAPFVFLAVIAVLVALFAALAADYSCARKWEGSGMRSEWKLGAGCRVQLPNGTWIPAENVREVKP